ncbi:hypothetical protein DWW10_20745 [Bacteroides intestinalis]|uniref:Uncharacterized protein n=1 Tax=Bacteroides intestinalis TaxID=329854 RepID=A0A412XV00_9BACE|nr:hypothetical protein DWW10_20745 [Bacteroides intestinalis]DAR52344.1 MAG TPA: hypothetical protein [Caudoviricetes sp.]
MQRPPKKYIVQIDNFRLAEFIFYWMYYDQPCSLLFQKPRTEGLTAVKLIVDNDEAANFLLRAKEKTGCKLYTVDQ